MPSKVQPESKVFKTSRFSKKARKAKISDADLCEAMAQVMKGQCDDLGGGVFKKRLNENMHRGIILAKGGKLWIYEDIFAKKDLDNINDDELADFRVLAKAYEGLIDQQLQSLLKDGDLMEICNAK
jgi:hypothetical protein